MNRLRFQQKLAGTMVMTLIYTLGILMIDIAASTMRVKCWDTYRDASENVYPEDPPSNVEFWPLHTRSTHVIQRMFTYIFQHCFGGGGRWMDAQISIGSFRYINIQLGNEAERTQTKEQASLLFIHLFCLCPLSLTVMLNFNISKGPYYSSSKLLFCDFSDIFHKCPNFLWPAL